MAGRDGRLDEGGSVAQLSDRHELGRQLARRK
jgi:hypothetical protein